MLVRAGKCKEKSHCAASIVIVLNSIGTFICFSLRVLASTRIIHDDKKFCYYFVLHSYYSIIILLCYIKPLLFMLA